MDTKSISDLIEKAEILIANKATEKSPEFIEWREDVMALFESSGDERLVRFMKNRRFGPKVFFNSEEPDSASGCAGSIKAVITKLNELLEESK